MCLPNLLLLKSFRYSHLTKNKRDIQRNPTNYIILVPVKKVYALILMLTLSITIIPLREVGKLLWGQTMNEEIPAHDTGVKKPVLLEEILHPNHHHDFTLSSFLISRLDYFICTENLVPTPILDPPLLPPDLG